MKVPSSSRKRYLGGADWCVAALRQGTLETTGRPTTFHVAVFFAGRLDPARLQDRFQDYCARFPLLWGRAARCWCLAPYWKSPADSAARKAPFRHVADGVVSYAGDRSGYGNTVEIDHGNGYVTRYAHNSRLVRQVGDLVRAGQEIARAGSSGRSTGAHVHFELWQDGVVVNPRKFLGHNNALARHGPGRG